MRNLNRLLAEQDFSKPSWQYLSKDLNFTTVQASNERVSDGAKIRFKTCLFHVA